MASAMARKMVVGVIQFACKQDAAANSNKAEHFVRQASAQVCLELMSMSPFGTSQLTKQQGADIVVLPELFLGHYFCKEHKAEHFLKALPCSVEKNPFLAQFSKLAKELNVVIPFSFFEVCNQVHFNTVAMIDSDGAILGKYRKSHIPTGPGYQEKFYFSPGDTGFRVFRTRKAAIGVGICWDQASICSPLALSPRNVLNPTDFWSAQWFPECARSLALDGAEMLLYPSAIGSEPQDPSVCSKGAWQRVMQGHAAANLMPVIASNRIGKEEGAEGDVTFYGGSFIADETGEKVKELGEQEEGVAVHEVDLDRVKQHRAVWGLFRDRRPDLYQRLSSLDGGAEG